MVMVVQGNDILYNDLPTLNFKRNLKHTMTKLERKWKCAASLINQTVNYWAWKPNYPCCCLNTKETMLKEIQELQQNKSKSNYINLYSDPSPLVQLWLLEVTINNLSNLISNLQKKKLISNYTLILQSLTISPAVAFGGNWKWHEQFNISNLQKVN